MSQIDDPRKLEPECMLTVQDQSIGLTGFVVIDTTVDGHACGGLRLFNDVSITQLRDLSRGMTLKYGFSGMRQGGAKAGIIGDPDMGPEQRRRLMMRFGELISPLLLTRRYISGPDMSVSHEDIGDLMRGAGADVPVPRRRYGKRSGLFTAMAVMVATEACAVHRSVELRGKTIAIEGFGSVGSALASLMATKHGMKVVAVSTTHGALYNPDGLDVERLLALRAAHGNASVDHYTGADRIGLEDLILLPVEVLSPCARQYPIGMHNAEKIAARMVVPGANNPVTYDAEVVLHRRGIPSIPYFAANCGGVLGNRMEVLGVTERYIEELIRRKNAWRIRQLLDLSLERNEPMIFIAERYAMNRFRTIQRAAIQKNSGQRVRRVALSAFNKGFVPSFVTKPLGPWYLEHTMGNDTPIPEMVS